MKYCDFLKALTLAIILLCSCHSHHSHSEEEHEHHHIQIAQYTDNMELFAELSPMEVNEENELLAHFTYLDNFKPVEEGVVTVSIDIAGKKTSIKADSPERPGIYHLHFTPQASGNAVITISITTPKGDAIFHIDGLKAFDDEEEAHEDAEERELSSANGVTFTKEMSWNMNFSTEEVKKEAIGRVIHTMAQVQPSQGDEVTISAQVDGIVTLTSRNLTTGSFISKGQGICTIDASKTANNNLRVEYAQAEASFNHAQSEYERLKSLEADRLVTATQLNEAKAAYESAKAVYNNLKGHFSTGTQQVNATQGGYLKDIYVHSGDYVTTGQSIATIAQNKTLRLKAEVQPSYYELLKDITDATIKKMNSEEVVALDAVGGRMVSYGRLTDGDNPLIPVIFEINNTSGLIAGAFVDMYIKTRSASEALTVPSISVLEEQGNYFVFLQIHPELFEKRQVTIGATDGLRTEIKSGLKEADRIVAKGAVLVKLQQATGSVDPHSGHHH